MAGYNTIRGLKIKYLSADPAGAEAGQVWYNSVTSKLRVDSILSAASWASAPGPNRNNNAASSGGTPTAAILHGNLGYNGPAAAEAEEWDGSSWANITSSPSTNQGYNVGCGTVSDFSSFGGGYGPPVPGSTSVYDWNGSGWTTGASLTVPGNIEGGCCGPGQNALFCGGSGPGFAGSLNSTIERTGASWASGGTMATARYIPSVTGTKADAIASGGVISPYTNLVESYNGSSWTNETVLPSVRGYSGVAGTSSSDQFIFGGTTGSGSLATSFKYNGSSWSADASMAIAKASLGGFGTSTAALCSAGNNASPGVSETYAGGSLSAATISTS
jgi:hypothetical protein